MCLYCLCVSLTDAAFYRTSELKMCYFPPISQSKKADMPYFQTLPDFERNEKLLKLLMLLFKILYYRGYLGKI